MKHACLSLLLAFMAFLFSGCIASRIDSITPEMTKEDALRTIGEPDAIDEKAKIIMLKEKVSQPFYHELMFFHYSYLNETQKAKNEIALAYSIRGIDFDKIPKEAADKLKSYESLAVFHAKRGNPEKGGEYIEKLDELAESIATERTVYETVEIEFPVKSEETESHWTYYGQMRDNYINFTIVFDAKGRYLRHKILGRNTRQAEIDELRYIGISYGGETSQEKQQRILNQQHQQRVEFQQMQMNHITQQIQNMQSPALRRR